MKQVLLSLLVLVLTLAVSTSGVSAQESPSVLYVPLIGLTSVPSPLALPGGAGNVKYSYAVKNFLKEEALTDVNVVDDTCNTITFVGGDDNFNSKLEFDETWRYTCTTKLSGTTQSTATATGRANNITATHKAYATVVVGVKDPPPLVSIINVTKVAYPLSLPAEGGDITFTYKVSNPGEVPLSNVTVIDDKCNILAGRLGDTNVNNLLDIHEVWIYTCTINLKQTVTNTVKVQAYANGLRAVDEATITVKVETPGTSASPDLPDAGDEPKLNTTVWGAMLLIFVILMMYYVLLQKNKLRKKLRRNSNFRKW